jgi:hypothetical protein
MPTPTDANPNDWTVALNNDFSTNPLDDPDSQWELGFGWGLGSSSWPDEANAEEVYVRNGVLYLVVTHEGGSNPQAGVIHTKGTYEFGPGSYHEARVKIPSDGRFASAYWSKTSRDPPEWPPEVDFYEFLGEQNKSNIDHTVHYVDGGGDPGGDHQIAYPDGNDTPTGTDLSKGFHTYGFEWADGGASDGSEDVFRWYFDGEVVATLDASVTDSSGNDWNGADALQSCRKGAPFYIILGCSSDASPDSGETLTSHTEVEYTRSFEYTPGGGNAGSIDDGTSDGSTGLDGTRTSSSSSVELPVADCEFVEARTYGSGGGGGNGTAGGDGATGGGASLPSGTGDVGGGASYSDLYTGANADTVVPADDGVALTEAIESASPDEHIHLNGGRYEIDRVQLETDGIRITGDRGVTTATTSLSTESGDVATDGGADDGAPGPIIAAMGPEARPIQANASDFLISGIRFEGPDATWDGEEGSNDHYPVGIDHQSGSGMIAANLEMYGWEAIAVAPRADGPDTVAFNSLHDQPGASMGYGVQSGPSSGQTLIEKNYFANNRHSVAADPENAGFEVRDNIFAPRALNHLVDQHGDNGKNGRAGGDLYIHHNDFLITNSANQESIRVRGTPAVRCLVEANQFYQTDKSLAVRQSSEPKYSSGDAFASAADPSGFQNMSLVGNYFGESGAPSDVGARTG